MLTWLLSVLWKRLGVSWGSQALCSRLAVIPCLQPLSPPPCQCPSVFLQAVTPLFADTGWGTQLAPVLPYKIPKRSLAEFFMPLCSQPAMPCRGTHFSLLKHLYSNEKNMQSFDPMLLPICTTDVLRSPTPDGCFTRNCANAKSKDSSCPQIHQEIARRWKDVGPGNNE